MENYIRIGKFVSAFGVKGELILQHSLGKKNSFKTAEALFIEDRKDAFLPYFIQSSRIKSEEETYVQLEEVTNREQAQVLVSKTIWLREADFKKLAASSSPISLLGFHVYQQKELLGEILEVIEQPHQLLCRINWNGKEAFIPIHEESLDKIDKRNRKVLVRLPDGLLDIYR